MKTSKVKSRFVSRRGDLLVGDGPLDQTTKKSTLELGRFLGKKDYYSPDQDRDEEGQFAPEGVGVRSGEGGGKKGADALSEGERDTIQNYVDGSGDINNGLRAGKSSFRSDRADLIESMDAIMLRSKLSEDTQVYRGASKKVGKTL